MSGNIDIQAMTVITGVLGFFFILVAMFKNFGRRNSNQIYMPGQPPRSVDSEEVKLSDPFVTPKEAAAEKAQAALPATGEKPVAHGVVDKSSFKQFSPDISLVADSKIRNDADYEWE